LAGWIKKAQVLQEAWEMNKRFHGMIFVLIPVVIILTITVITPVLDIRPEGSFREAHNRIQLTASAWARELPDRTDLSIIPAEIDLGQLGPGGMRRGSVMLKKAAPGSVDWSLITPAGWSAAHEKILTGALKGESDLLRFQLKILSNGPEDEQKSEKSRYSAQLLFEAGKDFSAFTRKIEPGHHRELVRLHTVSGPKSFYILFKFVDMTTQPLLSIDPFHLDFASAVQGEQVSRRVRVTNNGWDTLRWRAAAGGINDPQAVRTIGAGKYISFLNEEIAGSGHYTVARHLKERLELQGKWAENQGYPHAASDGQTLRFHFTGTGIAVYFWRGPATGQLTAFVNDRFIFQQDGLSEQKERFEWQVAEGLSGGSHVLTLVNPTGPVAIEGVRIYGSDIMPLDPGYVAISPDHGAVTRQTNYINITVNTRSLPPGQYGGHVLFDSNGGQKEVELSLDVIADNIPRTLDVYRYSQGPDYFLTTNPQAESATLQARGYTKQGIAFRLFNPGMPGTTEFYRWFHPQKRDHFYGYDLKGVKRSMQGYILEGTIGNIATSRLTHTRELYRWYNASGEHYFYSIDPKGEGIEKKGYRYDGIAGYVKP
jgi:hypothetical protein